VSLESPDPMICCPPVSSGDVVEMEAHCGAVNIADLDRPRTGTVRFDDPIGHRSVDL
jgi:hypothetical protein